MTDLLFLLQLGECVLGILDDVDTRRVDLIKDHLVILDVSLDHGLQLPRSEVALVNLGRYEASRLEFTHPSVGRVLTRLFH